ncbi:hypothetical protein EON65_37595, partial [archaeon]
MNGPKDGIANAVRELVTRIAEAPDRKPNSGGPPPVCACACMIWMGTFIGMGIGMDMCVTHVWNMELMLYLWMYMYNSLAPSLPSKPLPPP